MRVIKASLALGTSPARLLFTFPASPTLRIGLISRFSTMATMNPDMKKERATASFDPREMTYWLDGGKAKTERKERIRQMVIDDPVYNKKDLAYNDRVQIYTRALEKINRVQVVRREKKLNEDDTRLYRFYIGDTLPTFLHDQVFLPNLMGQMSPEQQAKWVEKAQNYEIIGCYAQTELGHGSNVRGLETTATFIPGTDEFELHTPSLRATKYWPGCMGRTANFSVVYARLLLPEKGGLKDYGVHPFLVQLRSLVDHKFLKGITTGDIGPKFGTPGNDNGWLRMDHVRIPRDQMLMRFSKVDRQGVYSTPPHAKLSYGTMVVVRAGLVASASNSLGHAVTIGIRYSAVRRQGYEGKNTHETQIIDYRMQQYRLFPHLAAAYALHCTGRYMLSLYDNLSSQMQGGDMSALPEVHATSSGLKSLTTSIAANGIEDIRRSCGGHGYLVASGLPNLYGDYVQSVTVEGDNYLLTQQTTRFLLKAFESAQNGKPNKAPGLAYLVNVDALLNEKCVARDQYAFRTREVQVRAYEHRAALAIRLTAEVIADAMGAGKSPTEAWNDALVDIYRASRAHCMLTIVSTFWRTVEETKSTAPKLAGVLGRLCQLFALHGIESDLGEFTQDGYLDAAQVREVRATTRTLLDEIRPDAVALVDSFNFTDFELNSALGVYDGNVYEALMEWSSRSPLNATEVPAGYEKYLKPLFHKTGPFAAKL